MTTPENATDKKYGLLVLSFALLSLGGILIYIGSHNFAIRAAGVAVVMVSAYLINVRSRSVVSLQRNQAKNRRVTTGLWIASVSLVPVLAGAWYLLNLDAVNGGKETWPADVFAGVGLVCAVVWGLLVAKIRMDGRRGQ